ncbi:lysoplasmalogenase family protein [Ferruginibacter paludis]|nr:lysoplasmalogenase family protein [Ferruginibacter paludis]MDN3655019.1 lysoplasmalogenase family protein [Ferruginibacter paludis]
MKNKTIAYFFGLCCVTDILSNTFGISILHSIAKPLLMPSLMLLLVMETGPVKDKRFLLMLLGLFFGWLGDVLLMFETMQPIFFILGLVGFLIGHLFYIFYFRQIASVITLTKKGNLFFILPVAIYVVGLLYLLFPSWERLKFQ